MSVKKTVVAKTTKPAAPVVAQVVPTQETSNNAGLTPQGAQTAQVAAQATVARPSKLLDDVALSTEKVISKEPTVRMFIPLSPGETISPQNVLPVGINGYFRAYEKGKWHDIPESFAAEVQNHLSMSDPSMTKEGQRLNVNNERIVDGEKSSDALN